MTIIQQLVDFIANSSVQRNLWLHTDELKVYVRKAQHLIGGNRMVVTLDIASIEVYEEHQGKKLFSSFVREAHALNPWQATYMENTLNPVVAAWCERNNWKPAPLLPQCYYLEK